METDECQAAGRDRSYRDGENEKRGGKGWCPMKRVRRPPRGTYPKSLASRSSKLKLRFLRKNPKRSKSHLEFCCCCCRDLAVWRFTVSASGMAPRGHYASPFLLGLCCPHGVCGVVSKNRGSLWLSLRGLVLKSTNDGGGVHELNSDPLEGGEVAVQIQMYTSPVAKDDQCH